MNITEAGRREVAGYKAEDLARHIISERRPFPLEKITLGMISTGMAKTPNDCSDKCRQKCVLKDFKVLSRF